MHKRTIERIAKLTQRRGEKTRLSQATGIDMAYLSRILRGLAIPGEEKADALSRELGIPASEFRSSR